MPADRAPSQKFYRARLPVENQATVHPAAPPACPALPTRSGRSRNRTVPLPDLFERIEALLAEFALRTRKIVIPHTGLAQRCRLPADGETGFIIGRSPAISNVYHRRQTKPAASHRLSRTCEKSEDIIATNFGSVFTRFAKNGIGA